MSIVCTKYRTKAKTGNAKLDNAKETLSNYSNEIDAVLSSIKNSFSNDGSFCSGVGTLVSRIKSAIGSCESAIESMKSSSMKEATRLDEIETA